MLTSARHNTAILIRKWRSGFQPLCLKRLSFDGRGRRGAPGEGNSPTPTPLFLLPLIGLLLLVPFPSQARESDFSSLGTIAVQDEGRVKPLDTVARETLKTVTGKEKLPLEPSLVHSSDPVDGFLSLVFNHQKWMAMDIVKVRSKPLKTAIGFDPDQKFFSPIQLRRNDKLQDAISFAFEKQGREIPLSEIDRQAIALNSQLRTFDDLSSLNSLPIVPPEDDGAAGEEASWRTLNQLMASGSDLSEPLSALLKSLEDAYLSGSPEEFRSASEDLVAYLRQINPSAYPSPGRLNRELLYNHLDGFRLAMIGYFFGFLLWLVALGVRKDFVFWTAWIVTLAGLLIHVTGFVLRYLISGHVPITNMFESLVFTALGIAFFSLLFEIIYRSRFFGISGGFTAAIILVMARILPIDSSIGVLVPVLRSNFWLLVHVVIIMLSYSAFTQAWALGHVYLIRILFKPNEVKSLKPMVNFIYRVLQAGVLLLAAGIILGAMWANVSWGRYWGWDPKETWSLICLFGYLALLHARYIGWIRDKGLAVGAVLAFMLVVMCYYGVNFVLKQGLHSYGSGSGGVGFALAYVIADTSFLLIVLGRLFLLDRLRAKS